MQPNSSPCDAPALLAPKPDGSLNYRRLKTATASREKPAFVTELSKATVFRSVDLKSGG